RDAAARYAAEADFEEWGGRLEIYGLDLRHTPSVEGFCHHLSVTRERLDFIVNNACQTVRRPPDFYRHMLERETASAERMPDHELQLLGGCTGLRRTDIVHAGNLPTLGSAELSQVALLADELLARDDLFPVGRLDQDLH